jgi:ABC-type lipoprotein export system ATPase subunit
MPKIPDETQGPPTLNLATTSPIELREVFGACSDGTGVSGISTTFAGGRLHLLRGTPEGGKAALWRFAGLLERPAAGEVFIHGGSTESMSEEARTELRTQRFGFVFAVPFLLSSFSVIENVAMPLFKISHVGPEEARRRTEALLDFVGLDECAEMVVDELSPLAQYQVAVARGLVNEPAALLIENLDGVLAGTELSTHLELLRNVASAFGTAIIATASPDLKPGIGDRVLDVIDGAIARDVEILPETCE